MKLLSNSKIIKNTNEAQLIAISKTSFLVGKECLNNKSIIFIENAKIKMTEPQKRDLFMIKMNVPAKTNKAKTILRIVTLLVCSISFLAALLRVFLIIGIIPTSSDIIAVIKLISEELISISLLFICMTMIVDK
jgi:hypothetical protein